MKVALVQMTSTNRLEDNLDRMRALALEASRGGSELVVFPEMAYFMGRQNEWTPLIDRYSEIVDKFASWAHELKVWLVPGTLREPSGKPGRYHNTLPVIDAHGQVTASYRKIHLFRANLPDRVYWEGQFCEAGGETVVTEGPGGLRLGLAVCYDLRFPELFRSLRERGAQVVLAPSSFTVPTGTAHWEVLVRARAIENQVFLLAPGQTGTVGDGAKTYGHTLAVAPWGDKLGEMPDGEGILRCDLDPARIAEAASRVDSWRSRRGELFPQISK